MNHVLDRDWFLAPAIDLELKRYVLLAYLQRVNARFAESKLYPYLTDLHDHMERLIKLREERSRLARQLLHDLVGLDLRAGKLQYAAVEDGNVLQVIDEVIDRSIPELHRAYDAGVALLEEIGASVYFSPVGLLPLRTSEGYLLLRQGAAARVYAYSIPLVQGGVETPLYQSVHTRYVTTCTVNIHHPYEQIKADLIRLDLSMPNPATFAFEIERPIPHVETYMPIVKQLVVAHLATMAGQ